MLETQCFDSSPRVKPQQKRPKLPENPETGDSDRAVGLGRFPSWLHRKLPQGSNLWETNHILRDNALNTVCEECKCPNRLECFTKKTATYLVAGKECTRACGFCDIDFAKAPAPLEADEPQRLVESVKQLGLQHVVITMVTRDDLEDGAADHIAKMIQELRQQLPEVTVEVLTSDFSGNQKAWDMVLEAKPEIFNHNI